MRYLLSYLKKDLKKKMVFLGGPRQVGKTTLTRDILAKKYKTFRYFNWDFDDHRRDVLEKKWHESDQLLIFDEFHKFPRWKNWIKGVYDVLGKNHHIILTGSARMDIYKKGRDSLLGRYHYYRLHPFTLDEIPKGISKKEAFSRLMTIGGFPEPFLENNLEEAERWRMERLNRVLREDIRDLENLRNIQNIKLFLDLLRARVSGLIVLSNLARDLYITYNTTKSWLGALENMYLLFLVRPLTSLPRMISKPPKVYFFDNADVQGGEGERFENLVATSLLKRIHFLQDTKGVVYNLHYIRDKEGREVDFALVKDGVCELLIEVKYSDDSVSRSLEYYSKKLQPKRSIQIVAELKHSYSKGLIEVLSPFDYFGDFFNTYSM